MLFQSILGIQKPEEIDTEKLQMPKYFYDLNLDQVVQEIMEEEKQYDLRRFYYYFARKEDLGYRQAVVKDLEEPEVLQSLKDFAIGIRRSKEYLGYIDTSDIEVQQKKWNMDAAHSYISSILKLQEDLELSCIQSEGLRLFRKWLNTYTLGDDFVSLKEDTIRLTELFNKMQYNIRIKRDRIIIHPEYLEEDYCKQLEDTFRKESTEQHFYQKNPFGTPMLSSLECEILEVLSKPYAQTFAELTEFHKKHRDFIDQTIKDFEIEIQFYLAFFEYRRKMEELGFSFCIPVISDGEEFDIQEGYDLALAKKNAVLHKEVVLNQCYYKPGERFLVVTGPNQGGKTTFARALGQIIYFSSIGLMVPSSQATLPVFDGIYTHFAVEENLDTGAGKLKEELLRLKDMMQSVTRHSFIIINEIFTSATSYDAYIMGKKVLEHFMNANCFGVYVTHIYELTKGDERIVSLVAALLNEESNIRTFKIERRQADGRSYANTIVEKHHMNYHEIKERIRR